MPRLLLQKVPIGRPCAVDLAACVCLDGLDLGLLHPGEIGVFVDPDRGELLLHLAAVLADDLLVGEVLLAGQHPPGRALIPALRAFQNRDGVELAARLTHAGHGRDHGLADAGGVERRILAIEIIRRHAVEPLDAIPVGFGLGEHVGDRIEAMLQRQRDDGVADVLVGEIEAEAIGQQPAQADDAVVG